MALVKKVKVSVSLCRFLNVPTNTLTSRSKVNKFMWKYIKDNHLGDFHKINPDPKLSKLLRYDDYVERVLNGRVSWSRRSSDRGEYIQKVETDTSLTYSVMQHLLAKHFGDKKNQLDYEDLNDDIINLLYFFNGRLQKTHRYLKMEILALEWDGIYTLKQIFDFIPAFEMKY